MDMDDESAIKILRKMLERNQGLSVWNQDEAYALANGIYALEHDSPKVTAYKEIIDNLRAESRKDKKTVCKYEEIIDALLYKIRKLEGKDD